MITGSLARVTKANLAPADTSSAADLIVGEMDLLLAVGATLFLHQGGAESYHRDPQGIHAQLEEQ